MASAPHSGHFIYDRWQVLQLVKDTARDLGLGEREVAVLAAHLSVLPKGPVRSDQVLVSYAQVSGILDRANCMDERRFRRGETRLAEVGLITRKLSGNARRFPVRDGRGQIVDAYGIDLRPLFLRVPELEERRRVLAEDAALRRATRSRISAGISALKRQLDALPQSVLDTLDALQNLARRSRATLADLASGEGQLRALADRLTTPKDPIQPDKCPADAGQIDRRIESNQKNIHTPNPDRALREAWDSCPKVQAYFPAPPRDAYHLARHLAELLSFIGISKTQMTEVLQAAPLPHLLRMLDYLLGKLRGIANPCGYFLAMLARYEEGHAVASGQVRKAIAGYDRGHNWDRGESRQRIL